MSELRLFFMFGVICEQFEFYFFFLQVRNYVFQEPFTGFVACLDIRLNEISAVHKNIGLCFWHKMNVFSRAEFISIQHCSEQQVQSSDFLSGTLVYCNDSY